jgi:hypothetical protein
MQRENFMITKHHKKWLKEESDRKQVSMSEILRAAIDAYMFQTKGDTNGTQR